MFINLLKKISIFNFVLLMPTLVLASENPEQIQEALKVKRQQVLSKTVLSNSKANSGNTVFSKSSLDGMLGIAGLGLNDNSVQALENYYGSTVEQAITANQALNTESEGVKVTSVGNVWLSSSHQFLESFSSSFSRGFGTAPENIDFSDRSAAAKQINDWAAEQTYIEEDQKSLITEVINEDMINDDLVAILAQALLFKGKWETEFNKDLTEGLTFNVPSENGFTNELRETMRMYDAYFPSNVEKANFSEEGNVAIVEIPYKGRSHSMLIVMPVDETQVGTKSFSSTLKVEDVYENYVANRKINDVELFETSLDRFEMPKFNISAEHKSLKQNLEESGFGEIFGNMSKMSAEPSAISFILQKAVIKVDEEGTEAAAVTIGGIETTSIRQPNNLLINGPFAYAIRDNNSKEILFEGIVSNPKLD